MPVLLDVSGPIAGGSFIAAIIALIRVAAAIIEWRKKRELKKADRETPYAPSTPPPAVLAPTAPWPHEQRILQVEQETAAFRREWVLRDEAERLRARVRELQREVQQVAEDAARLAQALAGERLAREDAERAFAAAEKRAGVLSGELAELKRELGGGHHGVASVTPLRPGPARPRGSK